MGCTIEFHPSLNWRHVLRPRLVENCRFLVQDMEDPLRAGDGVLDIRPQHRDLLDGLVEALDISKEGHDQSQRDHCAHQGLPAKEIPATYASDDRQRYVGQCFQRRSKRRGIGDRADVRVAVGGVDFLKLLDVLVGAVERLHFANRGNRLLQLGVDIPDLLTRDTKRLARLFREIQGCQEHDRRDGQRQ